ncbi:MAG: hypothetical protein NTZ42_02265 [Candidatus Gribaldobacteria bacterium]|nr:hypothetical protein [Candidatus Gribaldobacteria bacterium]
MLAKYWKIFSFIIAGGAVALSFSVYAATTTPIISAPTTTTPAIAVTNSGNTLIGGLIFEKDLIELLCLDSQWQGGEFLAGVGAYSDFIASSSKEFPDLQSKLADLADYQKTGQEKISAVCAAVGYSQAKAAFGDLDNFEKTVQSVLREIDSVIAKTFQDKADILKNKIPVSQKNQVRSSVAQMRASKQGELTSLANQLVKMAQDFLVAQLPKMQFPSPSEATGYATKATSDRQAEIKNQLTGMALQAQSLLRQSAQTKILEVLGGDSAALSIIVKDVQKNRDAIMANQQKRIGQLNKIKSQALQKRKEIAILILSSQVDNGASRLREKELLNENLSSPLFANTQQAVDYLKSIKQNFNQKVQAALLNNDEKALDAAISDGEASYRVLQLALPDILLNENSAQEFCSSTPTLKSQMQPQIDQLLVMVQKAAKPFSDKAKGCQKKAEKAGCAVFNKAFGEMAAIQQTAQRIDSIFVDGVAYCSGTASAMNDSGGVSLAGLRAFSLQLKQQLIDWQVNWSQYKNSF